MGWFDKKGDSEKQSKEEDSTCKDANFDLTDNANVSKKFGELGQKLKEKGSDGAIANMSLFTITACLAAGKSVYEQIQENHPEYRNDGYESCKKETLHKSELSEASEWLQHADWAYDNEYDVLRKKLKVKKFTLLRHDTLTAAGRVAHYVAICPERKIGVIALKGTSTLADVLTDALSNVIEIELENSFHSEYKAPKITCHEGIYTAAKMMADDTVDIVQHLFVPLNYRVVICGHSLGAGTACLLGLLLRSYIPSMSEKYPLQVFAYAPPPVLNYEACLACKSFTTSIVNNADVVPRISMNNLLTFDKYIGAIHDTLKAKELLPKSLAAAKKFADEILSSNGDSLLMTKEDVESYMKEFVIEDDLLDIQNIYIPGRIICLYQKGIRKETKKEDEESSQPAFGSFITDGEAKIYRVMIPSETFVTDHFCDSYRSSIDSMLSQMEK